MPLVPTRTHRPAAADPLRRRLLTALAGAPVLAGLGTCTGADDSSAETERIQLSVFWWGGQRRAELTEQALRLYSQRNPRVTFQVTWQGEAGYYERLATEASAGNAPDLFQIDDTYLTEYAQRAVLLDLAEDLRAGRLDLSTLAPGLSRYGQVGGRTVAVAAGTTTAALVCNRSLLRRLGLSAPTADMTYPAFIDWAAEVTAAGGGRVAGTGDGSGDHRALWLWLRGRGKELYQSGQLGCTDEDLVDWWEFWRDARARTAIPGPALTRRGNHGDPRRHLVVSGHTAVSYAWSSQLAELQAATRDELDLVAAPGPATAHWRRASLYWAGFAGTRHGPVVADVINFLTNDPVAGLSLGAERGLSANLQTREVVLREVTDAATQRTARYESALADRYGPAPLPPPAGNAAVRKLLLVAAESVQDGSVTPKRAAASFLTEANNALSW
ncbi:ABC transporter substrate-binding protein [Melissospora conviva]|uniref:ABC transporter substrate-binding protein n=1 Tax=Melissospora conviva TaxID=3388432 RepID=UPI003C22CC36